MGAVSSIASGTSSAVSDRTRIPGSWYRISGRLPQKWEDHAIGEVHAWDGAGATVRPAGPGLIDVEAWFAGEDAAEECLASWAELEGWVSRSGESTRAVEQIRDPGWLDASLAPRAPIRAGSFIVAGREEDFPEPTKGGHHRILLPAGRAFGTGEHATTRLCLEEIDRHGGRGAVLDLGTGSGILAVAAAMTCSGPILAMDRDPMVLDVAQENFCINGVQDKVRLMRGSWGEVPKKERFALIAANIHKSALVRGATALHHMLEAGGKAIVSGFLDKDRQAVATAWQEAGARLESVRQDGEWLVMVFERSAPTRSRGV